MSHATRPKPTGMIVCDICDQEIDDNADGSDGRANLMVRVSPAGGTASNRTRHVLLCWGRRRLNASDDPMPAVSYDFHGRCIAQLVRDHIANRESAPTP